MLVGLYKPEIVLISRKILHPNLNKMVRFFLPKPSWQFICLVVSNQTRNTSLVNSRSFYNKILGLCHVHIIYCVIITHPVQCSQVHLHDEGRSSEIYPLWSICEELVVERFDPKTITDLKNNLIKLEPGVSEYQLTRQKSSALRYTRVLRRTFSYT